MGRQQSIRQTPEVTPTRSRLLGMPFPALAELAIRTGHRATRNGHQVARDLIRKMFRENPTWGAPRILSELLLLGYDVAEQTVAKYLVRTRKPPSQTWRAFLDNHVPDIAGGDFFTASDRDLSCPVRLHRAPSRPAAFSHSRSRRHLGRLLHQACQ